jgi:galactose mutarotase-like enzyme
VPEGPEACSFRLVDTPETRAQFPFAFRLTLRYRLEHDRLICGFELHNPAATPLHASLGAHPAFRWPLGTAPREAHVILFDWLEPEPIRRLADRLIAPESVPTPVEGRVLPLRDALFAEDALIFDRIASRSVIFGAPGGPAIELGFPDFPHFALWTKPGGAPFLCLEPWQGHASPAGFAGEFPENPGVVALAPGETRCWHYAIRPLAVMPEF